MKNKKVNSKNKKQKNKKELIIFFSKLSIGGMERALIDFIRKSNLSKNFKITLYIGYVLEQSYLEEVKKYALVKVICKGKWNLFGKIKSYLLMNLHTIYYKLFKKYDCSICYTHHHKILSRLARAASSNNIVFVHTDLLKSRDDIQRKKLMKNVKFDKFKKVICVSHCARDSFMQIYPNYKGRVVVANNYINGENIIEKSKEKIDDFAFTSKNTFINIARHVDRHKRISLIIEAANLLKEDKLDFHVLLVGDGSDHAYYEELINRYDLNQYVTLLGSRINPYKYLKKSSAFLFSSRFEGYGIVLDEARVLNVPLITTDVADAKMIVSEGYGILCEGNKEGLYQGMKKFIQEGYKNKAFDYKKFNNNITKVIDDIVRS